MKIAMANQTDDITKVGKWKFSSTYGIMKSPKSKVLIIEPRLSKLLYHLSYNENSIVSRNYLINNIWTDTVVNEESLTRAICDLRKLLFINYDDLITIETIRRRGYRLKLKQEKKFDVLKSKLNPNIGYAILAMFFVIVLVLLIGSALGVVETKMVVTK